MLKNFTILKKSRLLLLTAFALITGSGSAWAETLTETFDAVTVTSRYLLSNGWVMVHNNGNYQGFGGSYDYQIKSGNYDGELGNSLYCSYSNENEYVVIPTKLCGTFTYYAKRAESSNGTIYFYEATKDGNSFTVTSTQLATASTSSSWGSKSFSLGDDGKYVAINLRASRIDQISATIYEDAAGPGFAVKDGSTKLTSPYAYSFGLATAGTTKAFTLSNPGTEATPIAVDVTGANGFTAVVEDNATSIPAGGEKTLTITMPSTTASGSIVVTPTGDGLSAFTFNVSGTVRDANKFFETFAGGALPEDWSSTGGWSYSSDEGGYAKQTIYSQYRLVTPILNFAENETLMLEAAYYSSASYCSFKVQYSTDGSTWNDATLSSNTFNSTWTSYTVSGIPAGKCYIGFYGKYVYLRNIYGGELPLEPNMKVTEPASLDFGVYDKDETPAPTKTFTIANTGRATLSGITVSSGNAAFTITNAPTTLAAGASQEVTITMATGTTGALSSLITVSATDMTDATFTVTGAVIPDGMPTEEFTDGLPANWTNVSWTFDNGEATGKSSSAYLTTPKLIISAGDLVVIKAKRYDSDTTDYLTVQGSDDNGATWTAYSKKLQNAEGLTYPDYGTIVISDIPTTVNKLRFVGYYAVIDEISGLTYAPVLSVTKDAAAVTTPAAYDFGECGADATVTYSFANTGAGTISITDVAITGAGATAYSTNWTTSTVAPFNLVITRTYDAGRAGSGAMEAVVTVTTSEGDFVINVTGTDKAANDPELAVTLGGDAVTTGDAANFGTKLQAAPSAKTYTITNSGTGTLTGTISTSDDTQFTVSKVSFSLGASESTTFDLALVFNTTYGAKAATITIHPTNDGLDDGSFDIAINATASTLDPEAWTEDFASGTLPMGWTATTWTIGTFSSYENKTTMALAPSGSTAGTITTPCLTAKEGDVLSWDAYFKWADEGLTVEYSTDEQLSWTSAGTTYGTADGTEGSGQVNYHKEMSFTAPADGNYYLRFTSTYQNGVDNFAGFKLNLPDHIMAITASSIPTSGQKATQSFNASVTVKESRGVNEENVVAKLYMGDEVIGTSETVTVEANETKQINFTATPTVAATSGAQMHIEVEWAGTTLSTDAVTRYVAEFVKLELTDTEEKEISTGYSAVYDQVTLNRTYVAGWNTIVLPVETALSEFGEGAKAYKFTKYNEGELTFTSDSKLSVATPYLLYLPSGLTKTLSWDLPVIYSSYVGADNIKTTYSGVTFQGTYAPMSAGTLDGKYVLGTQNGATKLYKATASTTMKGFRAYFEASAGARLTIVLDDEVSGIDTIENGELQMENVYNLQGQKVNNVNRKGLYIVNGKKTVIR